MYISYTYLFIQITDVLHDKKIVRSCKLQEDCCSNCYRGASEKLEGKILSWKLTVFPKRDFNTLQHSCYENARDADRRNGFLLAVKVFDKFFQIGEHGTVGPFFRKVAPSRNEYPICKCLRVKLIADDKNARGIYAINSFGLSHSSKYKSFDHCSLSSYIVQFLPGYLWIYRIHE